MMQIENVATSLLRQYESNVKIHTDKQIQKIADSITKFGMNQPIAIDENNMIIAGHGRFMACLSLGMEEVPCIRLSHMTEQQKKAYILVDNKLNMETGFDMKALQEELDTITDFKMDDFGFDLDFEIPDIDYALETKIKVRNICNLEYAEYPGVGKYDLPAVLPCYDVPEVIKWQPFNYAKSDKDRAGKGIHFYIHDYQFERIWNNPDAYIPMLREYEAVIQPDFSRYIDMPLATQIFQQYKSNWCARYMKENGVNVIPQIGWGSDTDFDYCLDGLPRGSVFAVSSNGLMVSDDAAEGFTETLNSAIGILEPKALIIVGMVPDGVKMDNIIQVDNFSQDRWDR